MFHLTVQVPYASSQKSGNFCFLMEYSFYKNNFYLGAIVQEDNALGMSEAVRHVVGCLEKFEANIVHWL